MGRSLDIWNMGDGFIKCGLKRSSYPCAYLAICETMIDDSG